MQSTDAVPVLVAESSAVTLRADPDEAIRAAAKAAIDAGDARRAVALLALLTGAEGRIDADKKLTLVKR